MKLWKLSVLVLLGSFILLGCVTATPYPAVPEDSNSATISFKWGNPGVRFVSFDGKPLPPPDRGTSWQPIILPAGRPILITVHANYEKESSAGGSGGLGLLVATASAVSGAVRYVNTDVVLTCPPLTPGTKYHLSFTKGAGYPGKNTLVLTDLSTKKRVYEQEFENREDKN
jgi:hypothetical protein